MKWVATSSSEAEYLACYYATKEGLYFAHLIEEVYGMNVFPITIRTDNMTVVNVLNKEAASVMTRHMATKFYALQDWVSEGYIDVKYVKSKENFADTLTKDRGNYDAFMKRFLKARESVKSLLLSTASDDESSIRPSSLHASRKVASPKACYASTNYGHTVGTTQQLKVEQSQPMGEKSTYRRRHQTMVEADNERL